MPTPIDFRDTQQFRTSDTPIFEDRPPAMEIEPEASPSVGAATSHILMITTAVAIGITLLILRGG